MSFLNIHFGKQCFCRKFKDPVLLFHHVVKYLKKICIGQILRSFSTPTTPLLADKQSQMLSGLFLIVSFLSLSTDMHF